MTNQPPRIKVIEFSLHPLDFEGSLVSLMNDLKEFMSEGWEGIDSDYEYNYGDSQSHRVYKLYKFREENDKEYALRIKKLDAEEAVKQAAKEKKEKLQQIREKLLTLSEEELKLLGL